MKELTYKDWEENPKQRLMWVWDYNEEEKRKRKVIYIDKSSDAYPSKFPVIALDNEGFVIRYAHCAEIETQRRMTKQEFVWWLKGNPTREWKYVISDGIKGFFTYSENEGSTLVDNDILIREDGGEWREPLVEVEK